MVGAMAVHSVITSMAQSPSGRLFCATNGNKIYVFEQNGTKSNEFGYVDGIDSLHSRANIVGFAPGETLVIWGKHRQTGGSDVIRSFFCFEEDGTLIKKSGSIHSSYFDAGGNVFTRIHSSGLIFRKHKMYSHYNYDSKTFYNPINLFPLILNRSIPLA